MRTTDILIKEFSTQDFLHEPAYGSMASECVGMAASYARMENAIAVLSDLRTNTSHIFYGGFAHVFGLGKGVKEDWVSSIWEKEIFSRIHPDDLAGKHLQELCFYHFVKRQPEGKRANYYLMSKLRMRTTTGSYIPVQHRMFYIFGASRKTLCLALCLYTPLTIDFPSRCVVVDSSDGHTIQPEKQDNEDILSARERQVLALIDKGLTSKDIAQLLCISINTVSRHRQDILGKLQVKNSIEACRMAKDLRII